MGFVFYICLFLFWFAEVKKKKLKNQKKSKIEDQAEHS